MPLLGLVLVASVYSHHFQPVVSFIPSQRRGIRTHIPPLVSQDAVLFETRDRPPPLLSPPDTSSSFDDEDEVCVIGDAEPICRIVSRSDGKLPTDDTLPTDVAPLLRKLDDIYHAMAHSETRVSGMDNHTTTKNSLHDAGFQLLSRRDLDLCEALNAGYLMRLSIVPDVAGLDPALAREWYPGEEDPLFDGRVLVYWRGYDKEVTEGRLPLRKIDYLQANLVQRSATYVRDKLNVVERYVGVVSVRAYRKVSSAVQSSVNAIVNRIPNPKFQSYLQKRWNDRRLSLRTRSSGRTGNIFKLARYGGSKVKFVGSPDPSDALTPFTICEVDDGYCAPAPGDQLFQALSVKTAEECRDVDHEMYDCLNNGGLRCPYDVEMSRAEQFTPSMQLLERVTMGNLVDKKQNWFRSLFSKSKLVEPTFKEVVVIWRPLPEKPSFKEVIRPPKFLYEIADMFDIDGLPDRPSELPPLTKPNIEIRAFSDVPMANLPAVMPKTKLIFRPADAFVFDFVSIVSFGLVLGSQRFDSPKLDLLALISVSLWIVRTVIRYSNKLARYDLLVKTFLTSKISHRNAGALKYLVNEAGAQRATRAALVHFWLTRRLLGRSLDREKIVVEGEREVNDLIRDDRLRSVNIDAALNDLEDLELVSSNEKEQIYVVSDEGKIQSLLRRAWNNILEDRVSLKTLVGRRRE